MHSPVPHQLPDYVRCGSGLYFMTWPRLLTIVLLAWAAVVVVVETAEHLPTESDLLADAPGAAPYLGGLKAAPRAAKPAARKLLGGGKGGKVRAPKPVAVRSFCRQRGSLYYLDTWRLAALGAPGWPAGWSQEAEFCDWAENVKTELRFRLCTFNRTVDTQISAHVHRDGWWNAAKMDMMEMLLPRVTETLEMPERTVVIDVGANIGFFTLLAATRGYDTVAVEPSRESVARLLFSLRANGIRGATTGRDEGSNTGHTRTPVSFVYANAASDAYNEAVLRFVPDNPGASWLVDKEGGVGEPVTTVFLDDLLDGPFRDPSSKAPHPSSDIAPSLDPTHVRLIKISAEASDARAVSGMRRMLGVGRVPYLLFVYNAEHVKNAGCDPNDMIKALLEAGYRLFHGGVFIYREPELGRFLKGMTGRSTELVFVREGAPFF